MKPLRAAAFGLLLAIPVARAAPADSLPTGVVLDTTTTSAGQPIIVPANPQVHAAVFVDPPGWASEWHIHHFPRYVYVLEGTLTVEGEDGSRSTIAAGQMSVEMMNKWHHGMNLGPGPVKFLVIDQVPPGSGANMIMRGH